MVFALITDKTQRCFTSSNRIRRQSKYYNDAHFSQSFDKDLIYGEWKDVAQTEEDIYKNSVDSENYSEYKRHKYPSKAFELNNDSNAQAFDTDLYKHFDKNEIYKQKENENSLNDIDENEKDVFLFTTDRSASDLRGGNRSKETNNKQNYNRGERQQRRHESMLSFDNETNKVLELVVYEICEPDLWYTAHVQLFEKLTTPEGNALWNDLTKHATPRYLICVITY